MAIKSWNDNSGNPADHPTTTDLSHLAGDPFAGQSMSAGNTISEVPPFGAAGSPSEAPTEILAHDVHDFGDEGHVATALDSPRTDGIGNNRIGESQ